MTRVRRFMATRHRPQWADSPQERHWRAQGQEDRADRDQDHRRQQSWAEFGMRRAFLLGFLVVAGFLAIDASGWEIPGVTLVFLVAPKRRHSAEDPPAQKNDSRKGWLRPGPGPAFSCRPAFSYPQDIRFRMPVAVAMARESGPQYSGQALPESRLHLWLPFHGHGVGHMARDCLQVTAGVWKNGAKP